MTRTTPPRASISYQRADTPQSDPGIHMSTNIDVDVEQALLPEPIQPQAEPAGQRARPARVDAKHEDQDNNEPTRSSQDHLQIALFWVLLVSGIIWTWCLLVCSPISSRWPAHFWICAVSMLGVKVVLPTNDQKTVVWIAAASIAFPILLDYLTLITERREQACAAQSEIYNQLFRSGVVSNGTAMV